MVLDIVKVDVIFEWVENDTRALTWHPRFWNTGSTISFELLATVKNGPVLAAHDRCRKLEEKNPFHSTSCGLLQPNAAASLILQIVRPTNCNELDPSKLQTCPCMLPAPLHQKKLRLTVLLQAFHEEPSRLQFVHGCPSTKWPWQIPQGWCFHSGGVLDDHKHSRTFMPTSFKSCSQWKYVKISAMTTCRPQKSTFLSLGRFILFFHPRLVRSFQQGQATHVYKMHLLQQPVTWTASKISLYQIIKTKKCTWTDNIGYWWISYDNRQQMMTAPAFPWVMSCVTLGEVPILIYLQAQDRTPRTHWRIFNRFNMS